MSWLPEELRLTTDELQTRLHRDKWYVSRLPEARKFFWESKWLQDMADRCHHEPWKYEWPLRVWLPGGSFYLIDLWSDE